MGHRLKVLGSQVVRCRVDSVGNGQHDPALAADLAVERVAEVALTARSHSYVSNGMTSMVTAIREDG